MATTALLILAATFVAGFLAGYAMRALRSQKRRAHYLMHGPYQSMSSNASQQSPRISAFGHPRRAF